MSQGLNPGPLLCLGEQDQCSCHRTQSGMNVDTEVSTAAVEHQARTGRGAGGTSATGPPQLQGGGNWGDSGKGAGCPVEEVEETAQGTHLQARRQAGNQWMHLDGRAAPFGGSRRCGGDLSRKPGCTGGRCRLRHPETRNGDPGRRSRGSPSAQLPPGGPERAEDHGEDT